MIERIRGTLQRVSEHDAAIEPAASGLWHRVLIPSYMHDRLADRLHAEIELFTLQYLESPNQGSSFVPRLVGFDTEAERAFFERFTTVKGVGTKKALRALAQPPAAVARAIAERDAEWLKTLPEIGKRLAETIIAELHGRVAESLAEGMMTPEMKPSPASAAVRDAISALVALGETRADAERWIQRARDLSPDGDADELVSVAYRARAAE